MTSGILLLGHGGIDSLEELPSFLSAIRKGRPYSTEFYQEVLGRYQLIGGKSPLGMICQSLAHQLEILENKPVAIGMKYGKPTIESALIELLNKQVTRCTVICLAPHYSALSIGQYEKQLKEALHALGTPLAYKLIPSWATHPSFIEAWVQTLQPLIWAAKTHAYHLLFTAHSLPLRPIQNGDPYVQELHSTSKLIAEHLNLKNDTWSLCFQSEAVTGEPWLSPTLDTALDELHPKGIQKLIVAPIGFVAEHVEVLYDIDIAFSQTCLKKGIELIRAPLFNDKPIMLTILHHLISSSQQASIPVPLTHT